MMDADNLLYCATDKEIFDVLMSAKQRIGVPVLLELAKDRGIFYSAQDTRETLVHRLSLLTHDYNDLSIMLDQRGHAGRSEKLTSVTLNTALTIEEIREVANEYIAESPSDEKVRAHQRGADQYVVNVQYSDVNYSKTRLVQRTPKEAGIEFHIEDGKTIIRMPSNTKARQVVDNIKGRLDSKKKKDIPLALIELTDFKTAAERTEFFTRLISTLTGFKLDNVTSVKVEPIKVVDAQGGGLTLVAGSDGGKATEEEQEALALIRNVALKGETLLASQEYQSLLKKGFFITSIVWRSKQTDFPYPIVEFEAAFEEPDIGKGFKYAVRGSLNFAEGEYTKTLRPIDEETRQKYLSLLEQTAASVIGMLETAYAGKPKTVALSGK